LQDVDITVPIPKGTRAKQLDIKIEKKHLKAGLKGQEPIMEVIIKKKKYFNKKSLSI